MGRQITAHHYCSHANEDVNQCVIYDGDGPNARLIGVEYIITDKLFKDLPDEEKKLWHSHIHEVKSGTLLAPKIDSISEHKVMEKLVNTYGKTFHLWQIDRGDKLPLGEPTLMMAFTKEGQLDERFIKERDKMYGVSKEKLMQQRADIKEPQKDPLADYWEKGRAPVCQITEVAMKFK